MTYATLQEAVDGLTADNQTLTQEVIASDQVSVTAKADAEAAKTAAETAETNAKQSEGVTLQHKQGAESAMALAAEHKTAAETQLSLAQTEKTAAEAARDATILASLGPDNDSLLSIASVYGSPSLMLDFAKQEFWKQGVYPWNRTALDPLVDLTFTRASTATYFDAQGVLQTAAADQMRFDYDPVTGESLGVLIEESRTNLISWSEDISQWGGAIIYTFTNNSSGAPDGGIYQTVTRDAAGSLTLPVIASDTDYTVTVYVKNPVGYTGTWNLVAYNATTAGSVRVLAQVDGDTGAITAEEVIELPNGWKKIKSTVTPTHGVGYSSGDELRFYANSGGNTEGGSLDIWGYQVEEGTFPTSYIPTAGVAVTRAADELSWLVGEEFNQERGAMTAEASVDPNSGIAPRVVSGNNRTSGFLGLSSTSKGQSYDGIAINTLNGVSRGEFFKIGMSFTGTSRSMSLAGGSVVSGERDVEQYALTPTTSLRFSGGSDITKFSGYIKSFALYPRAMTEAELIEVTT